jgi:hypothetical protein
VVHVAKSRSKKRRRFAAKIGNYFSNQAKHLTHRRPVSRKEAEAQGVVVQEIEKNKNFSESVKEYFYRWELLFNTPTPVTKIFQSEAELIVRKAPVVFLDRPVRIPQPPKPRPKR